MMGEKIRILLAKKNMSKAQLAEKLGYCPSNIYNKFKRDNFSEQELMKIAEILDCTFEGYFVLNDTKDRI